PSNSASNNQQNGNDSSTKPKPTGSSGTSSEDTASQAPSGKGWDTPDAVQQAYIDAYQSKKFDTVVSGACDAYKQKFGTDTADLEKQLAPYDIKATADGTPEVDGGTATAKIDLELTK